MCGEQTKVQPYRLLMGISLLIFILVVISFTYRYLSMWEDSLLLSEEKSMEEFRVVRFQQQVEQALELISSGQDINRRYPGDMTFLDLVVEDGNTEAAKLIINSGLELDFLGGSLNTLHYACIGGSLPIVDMLIQQGLPLDQMDDFEYPPIAYAVERGHADVVELLIKKGAKIDYRRSSIGSLLAFSAENSRRDGYWNADVINVLLRYGADPNEFGRHTTYSALHLISWDYYGEARDDSFRSILHEKILDSQYEAAKSLISAGANVNLRYGTWETPLHLAAKRGRTSLVELFLSNGADKNIKTGDNKTARDLAIESGHKDIAKMLR